MNTYSFIFIALLTFMNACREKSTMPPSEQEIARTKKELVEENKRNHQDEIAAIKSFIDSSHWPMQETRTGLHYWIYENGSGETAKKDDHVLITYTISLLNGTVCYRTDAENAKEIHIGHGQIETGLHEALQLMHTGDKARFIFPSHLAFGLTGDSQKIPQRATLVYDIQLLQILK
jgi:FKBP-type peptidyl-prolyl cis-trans isomerase FkpA